MTWYAGTWMDDHLAALAIAWACFALVVVLLRDHIDKRPKRHTRNRRHL